MEKEARDLRKARMIMKELIQTEQTFVSNMQKFEENFLAAFSAANGCVKGQWLREVCGTLPAVRGCNSELLRLLGDSLSSTSKDDKELSSFVQAVERVGAVFLQMAPFFKVYVPYAQMHNSALMGFSSEMETSPKLQAMVQNILTKEGVQQNFASYLIMPIQRLLKYPLLLSELKAACSGIGSQDSQLAVENIDNALKSLKQVAEDVNTKRKEAEELERLYQLTSTISGPDSEQLLAPGRHLVFSTASCSRLSGSAQSIDCEVLLFNDLLVVADSFNASSSGGDRWSSSLFSSNAAVHHTKKIAFLAHLSACSFHTGSTIGDAPAAASGTLVQVSKKSSSGGILSACLLSFDGQDDVQAFSIQANQLQQTVLDRERKLGEVKQSLSRNKASDMKALLENQYLKLQHASRARSMGSHGRFAATGMQAARSISDPVDISQEQKQESERDSSLLGLTSEEAGVASRQSSDGLTNSGGPDSSQRHLSIQRLSVVERKALCEQVSADNEELRKQLEHSKRLEENRIRRVSRDNLSAIENMYKSNPDGTSKNANGQPASLRRVSVDDANFGHAL